MAEIDHPEHYGGGDNPYEAIKVIEAWELGFCLGNTVKYIARAGKKAQTVDIDDLEKARWYLTREIHNRLLLLAPIPEERQTIRLCGNVLHVRPGESVTCIRYPDHEGPHESGEHVW